MIVVLVADALAVDDALDIVLTSGRRELAIDLRTARTRDRGYRRVGELVVPPESARPDGPWRAAFADFCAELVTPQYRIDLSRCATLHDAIQVHQVIRAVRRGLISRKPEEIIRN